MNNVVDVVGIEGVTKFIASSKLTKFIIFRNGARSGSTPVYDGSEHNTTQQVVNAFTSWAQNILSANPANNNAYEMLLFDKRTEIDFDDDLEEGKTTSKNKLGKVKKARFSFCLANFNPYGGNGNHINVQEAIKQALDQQKQETTMSALLIEIQSLKKRFEEEEEEEEEEDKPNAMQQMLFEFLKGTTANKSNVAMAGDNDVLKEETKQQSNTSTPVATKEDLEMIAKFAAKNPTMYKQYIANLKKFM